ncbi:MAG: hypothetical protein K0U10_06665, partial [Gammaproteobacteria bacterium]|nr:hypothetical protein [Gammaproteobacteria bacterium]
KILIIVGGNISAISSCSQFVCGLFSSESNQIDRMHEVPPLGAEIWNQHLGLSVTPEPLPSSLQQRLDADCPFWAAIERSALQEPAI